MKHFWCYLPEAMGFSIVMSRQFIYIYIHLEEIAGWSRDSCFFLNGCAFLGGKTWVGFTVMESLGFRLCWESWCYLSPGSQGSVGGIKTHAEPWLVIKAKVFFGGSCDIVYCVAVLPDASWWLLRPCEMHGCHWIIVKRLFDCWNVQLILVAVMEGYDM